LNRIRRLVGPLLLLALVLVPKPIAVVNPLPPAEPSAMRAPEHRAEFITLLILFAITMALSELLKPKPEIENARPAGLGEFQFPTATEGRVVPIVWGTVKQKGPNVIWYGDLRSTAITEKQKTGLFSSEKIVLGYRYRIGIQMAICRGGETPVGNLLRIWVGDDELWSGNVSMDGTAIDIDEPEFFGGDKQGAGGIVGTLRFHSGSRTQAVNTYLADGRQVISGATPAYRGTCNSVWEGGYIGNSENMKPWSFEIRRIPNGLSLGTPSVNSGNDANPMNVIYELLTNTEWGLGQPAADIDAANFVAAADALLAEGNGFSMILDSRMDAQEFLRQIEQQIDGVIYMDRSSGTWKCNLARGGYVVVDQLLVDEANTLEVMNFSRGAWSDTSNNVFIKFGSRDLEYKDTYAGAQDMANVKTQGNRVVSVEAYYPGVKDPTLANIIAWRFLRTVSYPLARAELVTNRDLWNHNEGDVVRFSNTKLGITDLPMRITKINLGLFQEGKISVTLVQDIFVFDVGVFAAPGTTHWTPPAQTVVSIPVADSLVFESPRKFSTIAPDNTGTLDHIWGGVQYQNDAATLVDIVSRPNTGAYTDAGDIAGFLVAGELNASMTAAGVQGSIEIDLDPDADAVDLLLSAMTAEATPEDIGQRLINLVMIGDEFFAFENAALISNQLVLTNGYRALLDSAAAPHASSDKVWILLGNLTDRVYTPGDDIDIKLLPKSATQALPVGSATNIDIAMDNRGRRPYPAVNLSMNGTGYPTGSVSMDTVGAGGPGSTLDDRGISVDFVRRDLRNIDEVTAVTDESSLPVDFPAEHGTEYAVEVRDDPAGANTLLFTTDYQGDGPIEISRTEILRNNAAAIPTALRMTVLCRHTYESVLRSALQNPYWDFTSTAPLITGDFNLGVLAMNADSANYTAAATATHTVNIGTAFATGDVEVRLNAGSWTTVVSATATTGTFAATLSDVIELRHTQSGVAGLQTFVEIVVSAVSVAYGVFTY